MKASNPVFIAEFRMYIEPEWIDGYNWSRNGVYVTNNRDLVLEVPDDHAVNVTFGSNVFTWYMYQGLGPHHIDDIMGAFDVLKETLENMGGVSCLFDRVGHHTEPFTKIEFADPKDRDYYETSQLSFKLF